MNMNKENLVTLLVIGLVISIVLYHNNLLPPLLCPSNEYAYPVYPQGTQGQPYIVPTVMVSATTTQRTGSYTASTAATSVSSSNALSLPTPISAIGGFLEANKPLLIVGLIIVVVLLLALGNRKSR